MDVHFCCPKCDHLMVTDHTGIGLVVVCPQCSQRVIVPDATATKPAPKNEKTVALKWTPPPATPRVDPKK
jgi:DNA-directed RNA polymerase subunit M/transcription elongation factor TFIIS